MAAECWGNVLRARRREVQATIGALGGNATLSNLVSLLCLDIAAAQVPRVVLPCAQV